MSKFEKLDISDVKKPTEYLGSGRRQKDDNKNRNSLNHKSDTKVHTLNISFDQSN